MNVKFINPFITSTIDTFKTMLNTEARPGKSALKRQGSTRASGHTMGSSHAACMRKQRRTARRSQGNAPARIPFVNLRTQGTHRSLHGSLDARSRSACHTVRVHTLEFVEVFGHQLVER
jgi:hypothetical protein